MWIQFAQELMHKRTKAHQCVEQSMTIWEGPSLQSRETKGNDADKEQIASKTWEIGMEPLIWERALKGFVSAECANQGKIQK